MQWSRLVIACAVGLGAAGVASAQSTWNVKTTSSGGTCSQNGASSGTYGNSYGCTGAVVSGGTAAGTTANVSAWSADRGTGTGQAISGAGSAWANAYISSQGSSGFGAASRTEGIGITSPDHAFDSILPGTFDMMLVQFDSSVVLDRIGFGWTGKQRNDVDCDGVAGGTTAYQCDSDVVVMRWDGNTGPILSGAGSTSVGSKDMLNSTIGAGGWSLVGTYLDQTGTFDTNADVNAGSSYWLIASYNTAMSNMGSGYFGNDAFKLNFLKTTNYKCPGGGEQVPGGGCSGGGGNSGQVPEPGSFALAAVALAGLGLRRRRKNG